MRRILLLSWCMIYSCLIFSQWKINHVSGSENAGIVMTYFISKDVGFASGGGGSYFGKTTDGGLTWTKISNNGTYDIKGDLFFFDSNIGLMGSENQGIRKTTDGGKTWNTIYGQSLYDFEVVGNIIYAATFDGLQKSINQGDTWQNIFNSEKVCNISFKDAQNGILTTGSNKVYLTSNGGTTWTYKSSIETGAYGNTISSISYFSNNNIIVISVNGYPSEEYLYKSTNNGTSWVKETIATGTGYPKLDKKGDAGILIYSWSGVKYTVDGGNTWINQGHSSPQVFYDCQIIDNYSAVIGGSYDLVMKNDNVNFYVEGSGYINDFFKNDTIPVTQRSDTLKMSITTPYTWSATTDQSWVKIINPTGSNGILNLKIQENTFSCHRFAKVSLNGSGFNTKSFIINQEGRGFFIEGEDTVEDNCHEFFFDKTTNTLEKTFKISSCQQKWKLVNKSDWMTLAPDSGIGSSNVVLKLKSFNSTSYRYTYIPIILDGVEAYENLAVIQYGIYNAFITPSRTSLSLNSKSNSSDTILVRSNTTWTASSNQAWLTLNPTSGTNNSILNLITTSENTSATARIATVTLTGTGVTTQTITVSQAGSSLPTNAGMITGTTAICQGQNSVVYTVPVISNATSYVWTLPTGATGTSTTNSITLSYGTTAVSGNITVKGHNTLGDGTASSLAITVNPLPLAAGTISGTTSVNKGQTGVVFTVPTITNATSYIWTLPTGATGTSTTNSITVSYGETAISGNISVKGINTCGEGSTSSLVITVNIKSLTISAGGLSKSLNSFEKSSLTSLKITGTLDARDFKIMRDSMPALSELDISATTIVAYSGTDVSNLYDYYPANTIPMLAFYFKQTLKSVVFPQSITRIGDSAFYGTKLSIINLPSKVTSLEGYSFSACISTTAINIPASVNSIAETSLRFFNGSITVDSGNNNYSSEEGLLFDKAKTTLLQCPISKSGNYFVPTSVINIGNAAFYLCNLLNSITLTPNILNIPILGFYGCSGLTSFSIPSSVKRIDSYSFTNCSGLKSIYAYQTTPIDLSASTDIFKGVDTLSCTLYVPTNSKILYKNAKEWKRFANIVEMTTGLQNEFNKNISIYPNPVKNELNIEFEGETNFSIINLMGQVIYSENLVNNTIVQTANLPSGVYLIKFKTGKTFEYRKFIKE